MIKAIALIAAAAMALFGLGAPQSIGVIGGADGPTSVILGMNDASTTTISFDANITTGFEWSSEILSGDSAVIDPNGSGYYSDPNPFNECGVGGTHYYKLNAVRPGFTVFRFSYARNWEFEPIEQVYMLAGVTDDLAISVRDITDSVYDGIVTELDHDAHTLRLSAVGQTPVDVQLAGDSPVPCLYYHVRVYCGEAVCPPEPAQAVAWSYVNRDAEIEILDGPGSYLDELAGIVTDISDIRGRSYTMILLVDDEYAHLCETESCKVVVDLTNDDAYYIPDIGDHMLVFYPGGVTYGGDPMKIVTYSAPVLLGEEN